MLKQHLAEMASRLHLWRSCIVRDPLQDQVGGGGPERGRQSEHSSEALRAWQRCRFSGTVASALASRELALADVDVANRALGPGAPFARRSWSEGLKLRLDANAAAVHRYATIERNQSERNERCEGGNRYISTSELIHDKSSCEEN